MRIGCGCGAQTNSDHFASYRAGIEVIVEDPLLDHWIVDDVPHGILKTPASSPVAQKAAKKGSEVLGKSKDAARSKEKEEGECLHSESGEVRLVGELVQKGVFVGDSVWRPPSGGRMDTESGK